MKQVVPGVWFREGDLMNLSHSNNNLTSRSKTIVVDANFPSGARLPMEAAANRVSTKPVKYVLDTQHHGDHAYGSPLGTETGATTIAWAGPRK